MAKKQRTELKSTGYEIFIGVLSILSIVNIFLLYLVRDPALDQVIDVMNAVFSGIFFIDFLYRLLTAPSRSRYFFRHFGWADLLASLPFPQFKILRIFRLIRVWRLLRTLGIRQIGRTLLKDRAGSALYVLLLMGIFVLQFGSLMMLYFETRQEGGNITSAPDAIWYTLVTISTVGYGDFYPVTQGGRILGAVVIVVGVGIFGTFTGYLANLFLAPRSEEAVEPEAETESTAAPASIGELRTLLAHAEADLARIKDLVGPDSTAG